MNSTFWTHINALFNSYNKFGERRSFHGKSEIASASPSPPKDPHISIHVCIHIHRYINAWIVHNCFAWSGGGGLAAYCCAKGKRKGTAFFSCGDGDAVVSLMEWCMQRLTCIRTYTWGEWEAQRAFCYKTLFWPVDEKMDG